jgi:hypothetical protein
MAQAYPRAATAVAAFGLDIVYVLIKPFARN